VWITGISQPDGQIASAVSRLTRPRVVTIELAASADLGRLQPFLQQLRAVGFVQQSYRRAAGRLVVTADRAETLQKVA
jgi:hypothetical protein